MPLYPSTPGALSLGYAPDDQTLRAMFDQQFGVPGAQGTATTLPAAIQGWDSLDVGSPTPIDQLPVPDVDVKDHRGFFERIQDRPGGRRALMAFGAAMLSGNGFLDGLGKAGLAYQTILDDEEQKNRPLVSKDGFFQYNYNPQTGQYDFQETAAGLRSRQIAREKLDSTYQGKVDVANINKDGKVEVANINDRFKRDELPFKDRWNAANNKARVEAARLSGQFSIQRAQIAAATAASKPPPAGVQRLLEDNQKAAMTAQTTLAQAEPVMDGLDSGKLNLGLFSNWINKGKLATGFGEDEESTLYGQFDTLMESLRNTILMDARGVQTDGDAERARAQLLSGTGSEESVRNNLRIVINNLRARQAYAQGRAQDLADDYGITTAGANAGAATAPAPRRSGSAPKSGSTSGVKWRIVQ